MVCGVYEIRNIKNDWVYIGSSNNIHSRWDQHRSGLEKGEHHSTTLQRAWNKYGSDSFEFEILEICSLADQFKAEQEWLDDVKPWAAEHKGYNEVKIAGKPPCPSTFSDELKYKMGVSFRGKPRGPMPEEQRQKVGDSKRDVPLKMTDEEIRARNSKTWETRRELGKDKHSEQTKQKISEAKKGKPNHKGRLMYTYNGETLSMIEWSERTGVKLSKIRGRVKVDWPEDKVFLNDQDASVYKGERIAKGKKGKPNGLKGVKVGPRSEEAKANMSAAKKGKPLPWYTPERMQEALQKSWTTRRANGTDKHTEATKAKISLTKRSK